MIRINLLSDRVTKPAARSGVDLSQRVTVACVLIFVFTVAVIGWQFWSLERESDALTQELTDADTELARLTTVQAQVEATEPGGPSLRCSWTSLTDFDRARADRFECSTPSAAPCRTGSGCRALRRMATRF